MDEEVKLDTDDRQWACLREAFERLGKSIYIAKWKESNITLSPGRWQLKVAHEEIPFIPDYSIRTTHPEEWQQYSNDWPNDGPIASEENVTQYEDVATRLKEVIWTSKLPIQAITEKGEIEIIPLSVWKDQTKQHRIAFYDSELIRVEETKHWTCWRIYVSEPHLKSLCNDADAQRRASVRKRAANENPKGGAPVQYNWENIESRISNALKRSESDTSNSAIARIVAKELEQIGSDPPVDSQMRARVKKVRDSFLE